MTDLPVGYHKVTVLVTDLEYEKLRRKAVISPSGTMSEVIRLKMRLAPLPYGIKRALEAMHREG